MEYKRLKEKLETILTLPELPFEEDLTAVDCKQMYDILCKIEQGKMIELPCPIRTMVYYIASLRRKKYCTTIMEIPFELDMLDSYGNNWFLTREEAEKRLKELQGETKL
jgi:hypothetical protein